ncbi:MAG: hypothetical protein JST26_05595 [Bacteroidetes bacterium]|nr:hypothetical protein [Bacteroidota bacterium]
MTKSFNAKKETVFRACKQVLKDLGMEINGSSLANGKILASTSGTLLSWGEDIEIKITEKGTYTLVSVSSNASSQLFSWGKDSANERNILNELGRKLS